jgi:hypothetical protein
MAGICQLYCLGHPVIIHSIRKSLDALFRQNFLWERFAMKRYGLRADAPTGCDFVLYALRGCP